MMSLPAFIRAYAAVRDPRFAKKLKRLGFHQVKGESSFAKSCVSFFLPPEEELRS